MPFQARISALYRDLLARSQQPAQAGTLPLSIAGHNCGWVFGPAIKAMASLDFVEIRETSVHVGENLHPGDELNQKLAHLATTLRQAGYAPGWRNELLEVRNATGTSIAAIERGVVRPLGLTTRAVHLSGWTSDSKIWVARRSLNKATDPGMWDTLVGGLVSHQEADDLALVREADEEAGLDAPDIANRTPMRWITQMRRQVKEGYQIEDVLTSECVLPAGVVPVNRDGEVMEIACMEPLRVLTLMEAGEFTLEASIVIAEDLLRRGGC